MIINETKKVCFIHIPKCAGTSIRRLLQDFDDLKGAHTGKVATHEQLGLLDYVHIPLPVLSEHFPELYQKVKSYHSFAIVRDPFERFASSVTQRLKMYHKKRLKDISDKDITTEIKNCIRFLKNNNELTLLPAEYIHFQRQSSYIFNEGKIISKLYLMEDIKACETDIEKIFNLETKTIGKSTQSNKTVVYRSDFIKKIYLIAKPYLVEFVKPLIPELIMAKLRDIIYVPRDRRMKLLFTNEYVTTFIQSYYARDIEIYNLLKRNDF